jgi:flagellar basal-body rod protein FlgC
MVSAINNALSGLFAAGRRLEVSANNIANQFSTKSRIDGETVNTPYIAQQVDQISLSNGGVTTQVRDVDPKTITIPDTNNPEASEDGTIQAPNVNLEKELINTLVASYDYKANLKTIKVQKDLDKSLLDILG